MEADTHLQTAERDGLKGSGRMRRGFQGSVTSGTHGGGCAGEVGWNKCYRGARDCVFPMVRYPLSPSPAKSSSRTPTHTPRNSPSERCTLAPVALSRKDQAGSVSLHRAAVFSMN